MLGLCFLGKLCGAAMAGALGSLRGAWGWYQVKLAQQPVRTQMITSGILWAAGDYAAQSISRGLERRRGVADAPHEETKKVAEESTDWKRVALASSFGVGFVGPVGHLWYEGLERLVIHGLKLRTNSVPFVATKVACDCVIFGPIHLLAFFTYMGLMSGRPWEIVKRDVERDFIPTYMTEGLGWAVVQVANFRLVPVRHQLLFVNVFCLIDSAFLSWVKHQDDAPWKKYLTSLVTPAKPSASAT
jgi:protein Mpv17